MATLLFRFGAFRLDPLARELLEDGRRVDLPLSTIDCLIYLIRHRDRPIGRDELASAVWGRVDVSEVSLSHAIMRLRRLLGDDGNAQRVIRTVPRLGYRWVMDDTREEAVEATAADGDRPAIEVAAMRSELQQTPAAPAPVPASPSSVRRGWPLWLFAPLLALMAAGATFWMMPRRPAPPIAVAATSPNSSLVLPVTIDAGAESAWLRLGLMDLIATQLRRGDLATTPSETVLALLKARSFKDEADVRADLPAAWLVRTRAALANGVWSVQLQAIGSERTLDIEAHADDALKAARAAADELLIKLGHTPPNDDFGDAALAEATLRQRINAAVLTGQLDVARRLIEQAPPALQASPEVALSQARVVFFAGDYQAGQQQAENLLARLPPDAAPGLRARVLNALGAAAFRQGRLDVAAQAFAATVALLHDDNDPGVLADAHRGNGSVASERNQLERAAEEYGRARTLYEISNDPFGVATIDLNLAVNAMQRGQPATALPLLESVRQRLQHLAATDALAATEVTLVETQLALLDHAGALATSAHFVSPENDAGSPRLRWQFTFARAAALSGAGQLAQAEALLARLRDASDPSADALARALADALAAQIALTRGDPAKAAELAAAAQTPELQARNREQYAQAALTRVRALQQIGQLAVAASEIARLRAWNATAPESTTAMLLSLADADQAVAEGKPDAALRRYADAMTAATARAIPEDMVRVGLPYVRQLIAQHRLDEAVSVNGRIAPWADRDMRAAWSEALVYSALGQATAASSALERARSLAGERSISDVVTASR
ncbi:MAG: winged helix-turn-helix domain-containing protein [Dokdonella sp.]